MHKIIFFHLANADTTLIQLSGGQNFLVDYAATKDKSDTSDKRADLPVELNNLVNNNFFDVVAFTHCDDDHVKGFSEYFYLEHAQKYQDGNRKKINELWVPASVLIEENLEDDARILRQEARHRLKNKSGIKVFSKPEKMKAWCENNLIKFKEVEHLFVGAGTTIEDLDGIALFVHSPFCTAIDDSGKEIDRNNSSIVLQGTFDNKYFSKLIIGSDIDYTVWNDIIKKTKYYENEGKLEWDIFHVSHHSSYKSLAEEKGNNKTQPDEEIKWLYETQGNLGSTLVSPSKPIPSEETTQPPHFQAANYYKDVAKTLNGEYKVTMEFPSKSKPEKMVFEIDDDRGVTLKKASLTTAVFTYRSSTPKAG